MKRHGLRVAATLAPLALALGACKSVGPDYTLPQHAYVNAPLANHALDDANGALVSRDAVPGNWWQLYDDPVLDGLVRDALKSNTDLRVAAANLARSRAALVVANEQGGFSGGAEAAVQRAQESAEQYLLENKLPVVNEGTVGINVSYELDLFGKLRRGVEAARADSEAVKAAGDLARITVVADVVRAYVEACSAGDELAIAKQSLALQQQRVKLSQRLRDAGRGNQTDVTRGVTQVRTLSADIPRFEGRRKVAQYQLAALLARAPADLPKAAAECERLPKLRQPIPIGDGAALLRRRPDVREAERQLAAATARIGVATAALYPSVSIGASAGSVGVAADLFSSTTNRWSFGPLISWSFPVNGQRARARGRSRDGRRTRALRRRRAECAARNAVEPRDLCRRRAAYGRAAHRVRVGPQFRRRNPSSLRGRPRIVHRRSRCDAHVDERAGAGRGGRRPGRGRPGAALPRARWRVGERRRDGCRLRRRDARERPVSAVASSPPARNAR